MHLEFGARAVLLGERTKYLVLAGDVVTFKTRNTILPTLFRTLFEHHADHVIYVLGNHEFYDCPVSYSEALQAYRDICAEAGVTLLHNESYETDDCVFYGTTLWSNAEIDGYQRMRDSRYMTYETMIAEHKLAVAEMERFLQKVGAKPVVMVTHHLPSLSLVQSKYLRYGCMNSCFASALDRFIAPPVGIWVYGHTHTPDKRHMNGVFLCCNPYGYAGENSSHEDLVVVVG